MKTSPDLILKHIFIKWDQAARFFTRTTVPIRKRAKFHICNGNILHNCASMRKNVNIACNPNAQKEATIAYCCTSFEINAIAIGNLRNERHRKRKWQSGFCVTVGFGYGGRGGDEFSPLFTGVMNKCHAKIFNLMKLKQLASY